MTQVDLPQLSLQRYVDLVKRRRWQVVPVSLLGLLVGGIVAFFVPRYFVADTLIVHQPVPGELQQNRPDPFVQIVDTAKSTIPLAVGEALDLLKWPETLALDRFGRQQFEREVESRVRVEDVNPGERRTYAQLRVQFRDRDGERAAALLNTLVQVWIAKRVSELRAPSEERARVAKEQADVSRRIVDALLSEKQDLEREYGIDPTFGGELPRSEWTKRVEQQAAQRAMLQEKQRERAQREGALATARERLAEIPARIAPDERQVMEVAAETEQGRLLIAQAMRAQIAYTVTLKPGTAAWRQYKRAYEMAMLQLRALVPKAEVDPDGLVPNPEFEELAAKIRTSEQELAGLAREIELIEQASAEEARRLERLITGFPAYEKKLDQLKEARANHEAASAELRDANETLRLLTRELPVKQERDALPPPAPTEPNVLVVALIGCILGLAAAIALILLLDLVQGTYKTLDDVERGLPVPVLGGVSHLETDEERHRATQSRRRASLFAAAVLTLITIVVTIYYVDATRLPPVVRDLLTMLLRG